MVDTTQLQPDQIAIVGIPFDQQSSYLRGPALAPARIRESLFCDSANMWTENDLDLAAGGWQDAGDVIFSEEERAFKTLKRQ